MNQVRLDKWLWAARFFKTRSLATQAVDHGKVRLAHERVKPARMLKGGECLQIDNGASEWEITVQALSDVRRAAELAQKLYVETEESLAKRQQQAEQRKYFKEPSLGIKGRPTKRDRRLLDKSGQ
jgi:ribosome-associated heat shock protein Hsp15